LTEQAGSSPSGLFCVQAQLHHPHDLAHDLHLQGGGSVSLDQRLDQLVELARDLGQLPLLALAAVASRRCPLTSSW